MYSVDAFPDVAGKYFLPFKTFRDFEGLSDQMNLWRDLQ